MLLTSIHFFLTEDGMAGSRAKEQLVTPPLVRTVHSPHSAGSILLC